MVRRWSLTGHFLILYYPHPHSTHHLVQASRRAGEAIRTAAAARRLERYACTLKMQQGLQWGFDKAPSNSTGMSVGFQQVLPGDGALGGRCVETPLAL
jgi:hypothetical protein